MLSKPLFHVNQLYNEHFVGVVPSRHAYVTYESMMPERVSMFSLMDGALIREATLSRECVVSCIAPKGDVAYGFSPDMKWMLRVFVTTDAIWFPSPIDHAAEPYDFSDCTLAVSGCGTWLVACYKYMPVGDGDEGYQTGGLAVYSRSSHKIVFTFGDVGTDQISPLLAPSSVCFTPDGNIIVADTGHDRLCVFRPTGELVKLHHAIRSPTFLACTQGAYLTLSKRTGAVVHVDAATGSVVKLLMQGANSYVEFLGEVAPDTVVVRYAEYLVRRRGFSFLHILRLRSAWMCMCLTYGPVLLRV